MQGKWTKRAALAVMAGLGLGLSLAGGATAQEKLKIGFIYVGPVGDFGWSYQHDVGRKAIEAAFPGRWKPPSWKACRKPTAIAPSSNSRAPATS